MEPFLRRQRSSGPLHGRSPRFFRVGVSGWMCSSAVLLWLLLGALGILGLSLLVSLTLLHTVCCMVQLSP